MYFDKEGNTISMEDWAKLFKDPKYKKIAVNSLDNGKRVSTVWLGLDHSFGPGRKLIFETMIFPECEYCERYETIEEARKGHLRAVEEAMKQEGVSR